METLDKHSIGAALREWFAWQSRYKTQKQVADASQISPSSLRDYLSGRRLPGPGPRSRLHEVTGLEVFRNH